MATRNHIVELNQIVHAILTLAVAIQFAQQVATTLLCAHVNQDLRVIHFHLEDVDQNVIWTAIAMQAELASTLGVLTPAQELVEYLHIAK